MQSSASDDNELIIEEHFNLPQLLAYVLNPFMAVGEWARGSGKSTGVIASRIIHNARVMPRSAGTFCSPSWRKFVDHMWPGIRKGFNEKLKMVEGRDYVFLKPPPDHWKLSDGQKARPYMAPGGFQHFISFRNGAGFHIISFDYRQTANALDTDWCLVDEAKLLNGEQVQEEVFNTLRGNNDFFGHRPEHKSRWIFSDKFVRTNSKQSRWISEYKEKASPPSMIQDALVHYLAIQEATNPAVIENLTRKLWAIQRKLVVYSEASAIDNIHALGLEFIENQAKSLTSYGFLTSIINMDVMKEDGDLFYALFSEYLHSYDASDNTRVALLIEKNGYDHYHSNRNSKLDTDVLIDKRLKLLLDFGGTYNWAVTCQKQYNIIRALKNFWVQKPLKYPDLIQLWCDYYVHHENREVELYYDVSANKENPGNVNTDAKVIIAILRKNKWKVIDKCEGLKDYIPHKVKYRFWEHALDYSSKRDERIPKFAYNRSNCHELAWSMSHAKLVSSTMEVRKYEKDKSDEKNDKIPQWQATHLSDCVDWLGIDYLDILMDNKKGYGTPMHKLN